MSDEKPKTTFHPMRGARPRAPAPVLFHPIYDPADITKAIVQLTGICPSTSEDFRDEGFVEADLSSEDRNRLRTLQRIVADPRGSRRQSIIGSADMVRRISALSQSLPHFSQVIDLVARAALVSARTATSLRIPPILLLGVTGIGKSFAMQRLARAIGADFAAIPINTTDAFRLRGLNTAWRGAKMGLIAEIILGATTSPIILADEIDKPAGGDRSEGPFDVWHSLLERENAKSLFLDSYLEVPFFADSITWICSANDVSALPPSVLDRLLVVEIPTPTREQLEVIVIGLYDKCREAYGGALPERLEGDVRDELACHNPRRIGRLLDLAVGYAAAAGRRHLSCDDVRRAERLAGDTAPDRSGFRGPVGFTRDWRPV